MSAAQYMCIADGKDGEVAAHLALKVAEWTQSRKMDTLLIHEFHASGADGARGAEMLLPKLEYLDDKALKGYLGSSGHLGQLRCEGCIDGKIAQRISSAYKLVLLVNGSAGLKTPSFVAANIPALIAVSALKEGVFKIACDLVSRMLERESGVYPVGLSIDRKDKNIAARLADKCRIPFWGFFDEVENLATKILDRSVKIEARRPEEGVSQQEDIVVKEVLDSVRKDVLLQDLGAHPGGEKIQKKITEASSLSLEKISAEQLKKVDRSKVLTRIIEETVGLGPIESLLADAEISEIMINGPDKIYMEKSGVISITPLRFQNTAHLMTLIERIVARVGRRIDESSPTVDARLADGSRVNIVLPPLAVDGPVVTIRRFAKRIKNMCEIVSMGMLCQRAADFLSACVGAKISTVVSGGTGSGKTTLLNVLAGAIDKRERIITIEDAAELSLGAEHVVRLESRPPNIEGAGEITIRDLVRNALRMRPDRIVVGECRGPEALDMLSAMNTGHEGSLTTVHANSPRDALSRIETMILMADTNLPLSAVREQIGRAISLIIQVGRKNNGWRIIEEIVEITGLEGATICLQTLARINPKSNGLETTGLIPKFAERLSARGVKLPPL